MLIIHLLLALTLIGVVLLQRSEGGGLGMGSGGGGGGGAMSSRSAASALAKVTWVLAIAFIITSLTLTIIAAQKSAGSSVIDRLGGYVADEKAEGSSLPATDDLLPPSADAAAPLVPRAD